MQGFPITVECARHSLNSDRLGFRNSTYLVLLFYEGLQAILLSLSSMDIILNTNLVEPQAAIAVSFYWSELHSTMACR